MSKTVEELLDEALSLQSMDKLVAFAKSSLSKGKQADLVVEMGNRPESLSSVEAREFIYDVVASIGEDLPDESTISLLELFESMAKAVRIGNTPEAAWHQNEIKKLALLGNQMGWAAIVLFMTEGTPIDVIRQIAWSVQLGMIRTTYDTQRQEAFINKMFILQGEGFKWDGSFSGVTMGAAMDKSMDLTKKVFNSVDGVLKMKSMPDSITGPIIHTPAKSGWGWRNNPEIKNMVIQMKQDSVDSVEMLASFMASEIASRSPDILPNVITGFFQNSSVSIDAKIEAYDKFFGEWNDPAAFPHLDVRYRKLVELAAKELGKIPDDKVYNHILKNFLAGKDRFNVDMLTANLKKALQGGRYLFEAINGKPELEKDANPIFMGVYKTVESMPPGHSEFDLESFGSSSTWLDRARILQEAGLMQSPPDFVTKTITLGYLLLMAGLPLGLWASVSGMSKKDMESRPELRETAKNIYLQNDDMRLKVQTLKGQIQRDVEQKEQMAPNKSLSPEKRSPIVSPSPKGGGTPMSKSKEKQYTSDNVHTDMTTINQRFTTQESLKNNMDIITQVADEYKLNPVQRKMLFCIRVLENGRRGCEFGVDDYNLSSPSRRYAPERVGIDVSTPAGQAKWDAQYKKLSLKVQAQYAAGTIAKRLPIDKDGKPIIASLAKRYCPENWQNWFSMMTKLMSQRPTTTSEAYIAMLRLGKSKESV